MTVLFDSLDSLKLFTGQGATSDALVIDQAMIDAFATLTHDRQWIHVDRDRAAADSPFGGTIAHGLLTLSMMPAWFGQCFSFRNRRSALNYGFDCIRFTSPVVSGAAVSSRFTLARVEEVQAGEARCHWHVEIGVADAQRPALVAHWLALYRFGPKDSR